MPQGNFFLVGYMLLQQYFVCAWTDKIRIECPILLRTRNISQKSKHVKLLYQSDMDGAEFHIRMAPFVNNAEKFIEYRTG